MRSENPNGRLGSGGQDITAGRIILWARESLLVTAPSSFPLPSPSPYFHRTLPPCPSFAVLGAWLCRGSPQSTEAQRFGGRGAQRGGGRETGFALHSLDDFAVQRELLYGTNPIPLGPGSRHDKGRCSLAASLTAIWGMRHSHVLWRLGDLSALRGYGPCECTSRGTFSFFKRWPWT